MLGFDTIGDSPLCGFGFDQDTYIDQTLVFIQTPVFGYVRNYGVSNNLILTQAVEYSNIFEINQTLLFDQAVEFGVDYVVPIVQTLGLTQSVLVSHVRNILNIQTLGLLQRIKINNIYNLLICQCISFQQKLFNAIDLSITQTLNFELIEREVLEQFLTLQQTIETNMDDITCCAPYGGAPDKSSTDNLSFSQAVTAAMVYNITVEQALTLLNTVSWRP